MQSPRLSLLATAAFLAAGCSDALSGAGPADPVALQRADAIAARSVEEALLAVEAPAPLSWLETPAGALPAPAPAPLVLEPRAVGPSAAAAPPAAPVPVSLEALLGTSVASASPHEPPLDLERLATEPAATPLPDSIGVLERWKERVRVKRRSEPMGRAGARQGTHSETEASLRVPVDDSVSLEGGVRVDSRDDPRVEEPRRSSIPRVGVEVRF